MNDYDRRLVALYDEDNPDGLGMRSRLLTRADPFKFYLPRDMSLWQACVGALSRLATVGVSPVRATAPWSA